VTLVDAAVAFVVGVFGAAAGWWIGRWLSRRHPNGG
jgi:membrane protein YqaA with SNARE-associated domain